jgi:hypothetical protein
MLASLLHLCQPIVALVVPRCGGSRVGNTRNKEQHWQAGALLFDSDYFADDATHTQKDFRMPVSDEQVSVHEDCLHR